MADTPSASEAQVAEGAQPQVGTPDPAQVAGTDAPDVGTLQRELAEARREAARYRTDLHPRT
jgi:hypothetical protein